MKATIKFLTPLIVLIGIPAWFIGCIFLAIMALDLLDLTDSVRYPLGAAAVIVGFCFALWSSKKICEPLFSWAGSR